MDSKVTANVWGAKRRVARRLALMGLIVILLGTLPVSAQGAKVNMPKPTGPYAVGRTIHEWVDSARAESYSGDPQAKRELVVSIWYPADASPDAKAAPYLPGSWAEVIKQGFGVDTGLVQDHIYADAPVATTSKSYPVLVFQPGNSTILFTYASLLEEVASHGYIVVGINETYNAPVTVFTDGRMVPGIPKASEVDQAQIDVWTADAQFVVNQLDRLNTDDARFGGKLDLKRLSFFGHSVGGAVTANVCHLDSRCLAGVDIDGALRMEEATVTQPFMLIFSQHPPCEQVAAENPGSTVQQCEAFVTEQTRLWDSLYTSARPGYRVTLAGSVHMSFTDNAFLIPLMPQMAESVKGATIDPERAWRIISDYALAFFARHLAGKDSPLLDGTSSGYPEVTFERNAH
jgi:predicted dienelactone hydrolase